MVFVTGCALRIILSYLNQQANDDHMWIIRTIAFEDWVPGLKDDWQGYQPKLYHWTVALLLRLVAPWVPDSGDVQIRIANLVNCAAAIALLLVARSWLRRSSLPTPTVLLTFGLLVLNPRLVGIGSQATNDTFVILFGTLSLFWGVRFFDAMSWRALFGMSGFAALAMLSKGNGLVVLLAHVCVFTAVLVRRTSHTAWPRVRLATAALLFVGVVISAAASFGPYLDNYRDGGSPFAQNMKAPPLPHFFEKTTAYRPGIRSVADGIMTFRLGDMLREPALMNYSLHDPDDPTNYDATGYPLHQTSLWSQLYGRLHFVHFDRWPRTWQSDSEIVHWIGRAALVLGLVPTGDLPDPLPDRVAAHRALRCGTDRLVHPPGIPERQPDPGSGTTLSGAVLRDVRRRRRPCRPSGPQRGSPVAAGAVQTDRDTGCGGRVAAQLPAGCGSELAENLLPWVCGSDVLFQPRVGTPPRD